MQENTSPGPVITAATLAGLVGAGAQFARLMGWIQMDDVQYTALMAFVLVLTNILFGLWARERVTPTANPKAENTIGKVVPLVPADGSKLASTGASISQPKGSKHGS